MKTKDICCCCLAASCSKDINQVYKYNGKLENYGAMLSTTFNVSSFSRKGICGKCIIKLQAAAAFKQQIITTELTLRAQSKPDDNDDDQGALNSDLRHENIKETANLDSYDNDDVDEGLIELKEQSNENFKETVKTKTEVKRKEQQSTTETNDQRGTGPILRENSLKILNNSTLTVFQWNKSSYTCFCCKTPFQEFKELKTHTESHTIQEIEKKIILQRNQPVKVEISSLNCKICHKVITDLDNLILHLTEHNIKIHEHLLIPFKIERMLRCQICSESFALFRLLNMHMNKHFQKFVCYVCGSGFSNLVFLKLHRSRLHRPIDCQKCGVTFKSKSEKKRHDIEYHGIKFERKQRFPCKFCKLRFFQEHLKVKHLVEAHGVIKPELSCQFCSKKFITKSLLNNHVKLVHMKERSHQCSVCSKVFYTNSHVVRHSVTHTGEKNFVCSICSNLFATKDSLRSHVKKIHVGH